MVCDAMVNRPFYKDKKKERKESLYVESPVSSVRGVINVIYYPYCLNMLLFYALNIKALM